MDMQACSETLRARVGDARSVPHAVHHQSLDAECTVGTAHANRAALLSGQPAPTTAFRMGKIRVTGDTSVAMKLQRLV